MKLYITYGDSEFGQGRQVLANGEWILYAGKFKPSIFGLFISRLVSEGDLRRLAYEAETDITSAEMIYVYVGVNAMRAGMDLIEKLLARGKRVVLTGCDCACDEKKEFAAKHGIDCVFTSFCGGTGLLTKIMQGEKD